MAFSTKSISWSLYGDASCSDSGRVFQGIFDVALVTSRRCQLVESRGDKPSDESLVWLKTTGLELVPEVQSRVEYLIERHPRNCDQQSTIIDTNLKDDDDEDDDVFPVAIENLSLSAEAVEELGLKNDKAELYCKLQLHNASGGGGFKSDGIEDTIRQESDWFSWKIQRAEEYRVRGNEAFRQESYSLAVQLYKRALAWLEPPAAWSHTALDVKGQYSIEELHQVNHVGVACYANLATSYSKINGDGDIDRCIAAASSALAIEDAHVKARYRRSQAYVQSKAFDQALADLTKLLELEPNNNLFRGALARARRAKSQLCKKQQTAFANLFEQQK
uniref:peptidylprolyl isomerase n=1 Tax=Hyaloperonospora arabidopsidis (strain Emoy2) TaxID=559515 RepID=M4BE43_HYAAE